MGQFFVRTVNKEVVMFWLTNAQKIHEQVVQPHKEVVWQIHGWNGQVVFYGDEDALFIFDPFEMKMHAFFKNTYLLHTIKKVENDGKGGGKFFVRMSGPGEVRFIIELGEEWEALLKLARGCLRSTRWLKKYDRN